MLKKRLLRRQKSRFLFMTLPNDTITVFKEISGNTSFTLVNSNDKKTILAISMQQSKDLSDTILLCGTDVLAKNYAKDLPQNFTNYQCNDDIIISKTGNDLASVIVSYVPYYTSDFSTTTEGTVYNPSTTISTTSDVTIYGSFSAGEMLISFFLFVLIWIQLLSFLAKGLNKIYTKKRFLGYSGGDVEIREDR